MSDKKIFFLCCFVKLRARENWKQMEQNIHSNVCMKDLFSDNDSVSLIFFSLLFFALPKAFNGTLTDINRSRDEWRLTLKYYALRSRLLSGVFFRFFFPSLSLNHLTDQVHKQHDPPRNQHNINDLIKSSIDGLCVCPAFSILSYIVIDKTFLFSTIWKALSIISATLKSIFSFKSCPP